MSRYFTKNELPGIGLGTWENTDPARCVQSVETAIRVGYRHIDTAQFYGNEKAVGKGIASSGIAREELFVATKIWIKSLDRAGVHGSTRESLEKLGLDYIDCLYVHWPAGNYNCRETLPAIKELQDEGLVRQIGVSNFTIELMEEALEILEGNIFANQVEMHPLLQQPRLHDYLVSKDIYLVAYSPFRHGTLFDHPGLQKIADKYDVSVAQVILAWQLEKEKLITIPKATGEAHIKDNFAAMKLNLEEEDIEKIDGFDCGDRYVDPPIAPWKG